MKFDFDGLHNEARQDWVEVACDENDPNAGTVHLCLREIPDKEFKRLEMLYRVSARSTYQNAKQLNEIDAASPEALEQVSQSAPVFLDASSKFDERRLELIQKMVVDHSPASFVVEFPARASETQISEYLSGLGSSPEDIADAIQTRRAELLFQHSTWSYKNEALPAAGEKTLRLYAKSDAFLSSLFNACKAFQTLAWETPEQVWTRTANEREQRAMSVSLDLTEEKYSKEAVALFTALVPLLTEKQQDILERGGRLLIQFPATETSPLG